jgi:guanylate kinase
LRNRKTDDDASIDKRMAKALFELSFAENFDEIVVNDDLEVAITKVVDLVKKFLPLNPLKGTI